MKTLLAACMLAAAPFVWAAGPGAPQGPAAVAIAGEVLEVQNVEGYTYLRLKTAQGDTWAAVPTAPVKKGAKVTVQNVTVMSNFESKTLKKTFPAVAFGTLAGAQPAAAAAGGGAAGPHGAAAKPAQAPDVQVPKATGPNARTVAEIMTKPADLKDKPVLVRGKIVKYSPAIMGKNWVHLRDGSGSAAAGTNDLLVTTTEQAKVGDIVTAKGVLRTDRDFGAGYSYKAIVEEATLQR